MVPAGGSGVAEPRPPCSRHRLPLQRCTPRGVRPPLSGAAVAALRGCSVPHGRYGPGRAEASGGCSCPLARRPPASSGERRAP